MLKLQISRRKLNFGLLILLTFFLVTPSCKKKDLKTATPVVQEPVKNEPPLTGYAALIKQKTNLIKTVVQQTTYKVYDGVDETHLAYNDYNDKPMAIYFLSVDLNKSGVTLEAATPSDGTNLNAKQKVTEMISYKNASHTDKEVLAAVNGDYWRVSTTETDPTPLGQPYGLVYKNGVALKDITKNGNYYYFSIQQSGSAYFGSKGDASIATIKEGLGGRYLLVQNGVEKPDQLNYNTAVEPRTAVGMLNPKNVVFMVVDGRSASYSQGLTMKDLAKMFKAIGATDAVNLDGGGSSTFAVKSGTSYTIKNRPSDGSARSVASAWTIMGKKL